MELGKLIYNKLNNNLSHKEEKAFRAWVNKSEDNHQLYLRLKELKLEGHDLTSLTTLNPDSAWEKVLQKVEANRVNRPRPVYLRKVLPYAAVFIAFLGLTYTFWILAKNTNSATIESSIQQNEITLRLSNGEIKVISSDSIQNIMLSPGHVITTKIGKSTLDYSHIGDLDELVFNTVDIPNGKRFKLVLSDSTIVYLNSGSSLKYPIHFLPTSPRNVELSGEAFFEVRKDNDHPFIVKSEDMNIRVLGTKFNVNSYKDDNSINTVLVEGSVGIYGANNPYNDKTATVLTPGYKAAWTGVGNKTLLEKVDTRFYTDWVHGKLVFRNLSFQDIVKKLQRHYNVTINNTYKALDNQVFTASFDVENIEEVLDSFKEDTQFAYDIDEDKITIYKPGLPKKRANMKNDD